MKGIDPRWRIALLACVAVFSSFPLARASGEEPDRKCSFVFGNTRRSYLLHLPPAVRSGAGPALVIVLHGGGGSGKGMIKLTNGEFDSLADKDSAIVIYPDAFDGTWNDGRTVRVNAKIDDVGFISALIDTLVQTRDVDPRRVYATGISNGAMMTYRLGCEKAGKFAAIAPVDGAITEPVASRCSPEAPLSVLVINNVDDPLVHWNGGDVTGPFGMRKLGRVLSVQQSIELWVSRNRCTTPPVITREPDKDPDDGTRVRREEYGEGEEGTEVILYAVEGGGHTWPGGVQYAPAFLIGKTTEDIDGSRVIWEFFMKHTR
jgi:polyhydroxybutyrate depolymerase